MFVLGPLGDQPLDLPGLAGGLVSRDDDRHGVQAGFDGREGAAVPEPDPQLPFGGADGDDGLQDAVVADAGDERGVDLGGVSDVAVDEQGARVEFLDGSDSLAGVLFGRVGGVAHGFLLVRRWRC